MPSHSIVQIEPVVTIASDDEQLIARARRGDRDAFTRLIEPRVHRLLRLATVIVGNPSDAHEVTQEALISAWAHLPSLRESDRFDAWLNRIVVNSCRNALRKRRRVREIDLSAGELIETEDANEARRRQRAILAAFDRLSVEERHILVLHHLDDLSVDAIAHQLRVPIGTAKSRLWRARRALERALEAEL